MKPRKRLSTRKIVLLSIIAVVVIGLAIIVALPSVAKSPDLSALLSEINGVVQVRNGAQDPFNQVDNGFLLKSIMQLQTKEESRVRLDLSTGSIVRLGQATIFSLESQTPAAGGLLSQIKLQAGRIWVVLKGGSLDVNTPGGLASVRGSYLSVWVEPATNSIAISCLEGSCGFKNAAGTVELTSGQKLTSTNTNILPTVEKMDQSDVQSWLDNCPESVAIVPQILNLLASSTPTLTPTSATGTATNTPTATLTATPTLDLTNLAGSGTPILPNGTATITPTLLTSPNPALSLTPTTSGTGGSALPPTATRSILPSSTPIGVPTLLPPTNTSVPLPTNTPLPPPTNTPKPLPTSTPVPPPPTPAPTAYP